MQSNHYRPVAEERRTPRVSIPALEQRSAGRLFARKLLAEGERVERNYGAEGKQLFPGMLLAKIRLRAAGCSRPISGRRQETYRRRLLRSWVRARTSTSSQGWRRHSG